MLFADEWSNSEGMKTPYTLQWVKASQLACDRSRPVYMLHGEPHAGLYPAFKGMNDDDVVIDFSDFGRSKTDRMKSVTAAKSERFGT